MQNSTKKPAKLLTTTLFNKKVNQISNKLKEHDGKFEKINNKLKEHDDKFDRVIDAIMDLHIKIDRNQEENNKRFAEITDVLQKNLDRMYKSLETYDFEITCTNEWIRRHEDLHKNILCKN